MCGDVTLLLVSLSRYLLTNLSHHSNKYLHMQLMVTLNKEYSWPTINSQVSTSTSSPAKYSSNSTLRPRTY